MISPALHKVTRTLNERTSAKGPTLVFIHGNSAASDVWKHQTDSDRFQEYPTVALDLPGHGESSRWDEYSLTRTVEAVVDSCDVYDEVVLVGHSLGGHLAIEALPKLNNCKGLLIFGTPPIKRPLNLQEAFHPDERMALLFQGRLSASEKESFVSGVCDEASPAYTLLLETLENTDPNFREGMGVSVSNGEFSDEAKLLKETKVPVAIFHGVDDALVNADYIEGLDLPSLWQQKIHYIEDSTHCPHVENPERFNRLLSQFLNSLD